jgi:hypothetical protein
MENALRVVERRIELKTVDWERREERAMDRTKSIKWQWRRKVS